MLPSKTLSKSFNMSGIAQNSEQLQTVAVATTRREDEKPPRTSRRNLRYAFGKMVRFPNSTFPWQLVGRKPQEFGSHVWRMVANMSTREGVVLLALASSELPFCRDTRFGAFFTG